MKWHFWRNAALATLLLSGCSPAQKQNEARSEERLQRLVFALKPDKNPEAMIEEKTQLQAFLSRELQLPVDVIVPLSSSVILEGFQNGTVDLGYLSATEMLTASRQNAASVLLAGEINGRTHYQSYWVTLKEKPYKSIADLKGKPVAFASKTSTSGYLIPHLALIKRGLLAEKADPEEFFGRGNVWYGSGYVSAIEQVLSGSSEAAAVSYYVIDEDRHLTAEQRDRLRNVDQQGPVPTHVIAVRHSLPDAERERLKQALRQFNAPAHAMLRLKLFGADLVEVDEEMHLAPIQEALVLTGKIQQ